MSAPCIYCGVRPDVPCKHKTEVAEPLPVFEEQPDGRRDSNMLRFKRSGARQRRKTDF